MRLLQKSNVKDLDYALAKTDTGFEETRQLTGAGGEADVGREVLDDEVRHVVAEGCGVDVGVGYGGDLREEGGEGGGQGCGGWDRGVVGAVGGLDEGFEVAGGGLGVWRADDGADDCDAGETCAAVG